MQVGYMRVSKADGSQALDLQRDALLAAGMQPQHLYEDLASGRREDRPGLAACLKALRPGDVLVVWKRWPRPAASDQYVLRPHLQGWSQSPDWEGSARHHDGSGETRLRDFCRAGGV